MQPLTASFVQQVKDALAHLHDQSYLQLHPLTARFVAVGINVPLHDLLCKTIEELRPAAHLPVADAAWRPYRALYLRYVRGLDVAVVAEMLTISPRQCRREHQKGLHAVAHRLSQHSAASPPLPNRPLETELEWLTARREVEETPVIEVMKSVLATLADLVTQRNVVLTAADLIDLPQVQTGRVLLRQVLLNTLTHLVERCANQEIVISGGYGKEEVTISLRCVANAAADTHSRPGNCSTDAREPIEERLAVVTQLIEMCKGTIAYQSQPEPVVKLSLPVHRTSTILLVDDNPDVIRLFRRYLSDTTYTLRSATTSDEAIQLVKEIQPSAIVLDVMMPNQDGWEILQYLKHQPTTRHIPVVICSVLHEQALAQSLGAAHFLTKPVTQQVLQRALLQVLANREIM